MSEQLLDCCNRNSLMNQQGGTGTVSYTHLDVYKRQSGSYALYPHEKYVAAWSVEAKFGSESFFEIANSVDEMCIRDRCSRTGCGYVFVG